MASTVQTTAVALRRGTTAANELFTGVQGELVVDLGADGTGTDINTTLRLHNAITTGGIPMARADMANVTSKALGANRTSLGEKNMAYADLSNIETATDPTSIITTLTGYGFAQESSVETLLVNYAKADMSNVNTANLATAGAGHTGKNLAYADTSNINTADLVNATTHPGTNGNKPLAYADLSNVDTSAITGNFASITLNNVTAASWETVKLAQNIESSSNKDGVIDPTNVTLGHYPTTQAVIDYVGSGGGGDLSQKMNVSFNNAASWDILYSDDQNYYTYTNDGAITVAGTGFVAGNDYYTGMILTDDRESMKVEVTAVNGSGNITTAKIKPEFGATDLSTHNTLLINNENGGSASITFTSTSAGTGIYRYVVSNITTITAGGFELEEYEDENNTSTIPALFIKAVTIDANGGITSYKFKPENGSTDITGTLTISSGTSGATDAEISAVCTNTFPPIGGAGLLKTRLTNLPGMSNNDALIEKDSDWRIRHNVAIPTNPVADDYYRIVTAGLVADAINSSASGDLKNTATGSNSLTILGTATAQSSATNVGKSATATNANATSLGTSARATGGGSTAVGKSSLASGNTSVALGAVAEATAQGAIMLGGGVNSEAQTLKVALRSSSTQATDEASGLFTLLQSNGTIPAGRLATVPSTNGSYIPVLTVNNGTLTITWTAYTPVQIVNSLPGSPDNNTVYAVKGS